MTMPSSLESARPFLDIESLCREVPDLDKIEVKKSILRKHFSKVLSARIDSATESFDPLTAKLIRKEKSVAKTVDLIEALRDNVLLSSYDELDLVPELLQRLENWSLKESLKNLEFSVKTWKAFVTFLRCRAFRVGGKDPPVPTSIPGLTRDGRLTELWPPWLRRVVTRGISTKEEASRFAMFCTTRNFPLPGQKQIKDAIETHRAVICDRKRDVDDRRLSDVYNLAFQVGRTARSSGDNRGFTPDPKESKAHLSLTSSASYGRSVELGGRAEEVNKLFRPWLEEVGLRPVHGQVVPGTYYTFWGLPFTVPSDFQTVPRWKWLCRDRTLRTTKSFSELINLDNPRKTVSGVENADTVAGLDFFTSYQLLWFAWESLLSSGVCTGRIFHSAWPFKGPKRSRDEHPYIKVSAIAEPGFKARIVTVAEWFVTIALQPAAHEMGALIAYHPSATSGMSRAFQLYEYVKRLPNVEKYSSDEYFLTSDLETATDYCPHAESKQMLMGFAAGFGITNPLFKSSFDLLCSPRQIFSVREEENLVTTSGVLMGDPLTKVVLTLFNLMAEAEARCLTIHGDWDGIRNSAYRIPHLEWVCMQAAGDDHIAKGPRSYLEKITAAHVRNGMKPHPFKNMVSPIGAYFCEEVLFVGDHGDFIGGKVPLSKCPYEKHPHVDAIKVRLLAPICKQAGGGGGEGKGETLPIFGKVQSLSKYLGWMPDTPYFRGVRVVTSLRVSHRYRMYMATGKDVIFNYVPTECGGVGLPAFHFSDEEISEMITKCLGPAEQTALSTIDSRTAAAFQRISSNSFTRGLDISSLVEKDFPARRNGLLALSESLNKGERIDARHPPPGFVREENGEDKTQYYWQGMSLSQQAAAWHTAGYISLGELLRMWERQIVQAALLSAEFRELHDVRTSKDYSKVPVPERVRTWRRMLMKSTVLHRMEDASFESFSTVHAIVRGEYKIKIESLNLVYVPFSLVTSVGDVYSGHTPIHIDERPLENDSSSLVGTSERKRRAQLKAMPIGTKPEPGLSVHGLPTERNSSTPARNPLAALIARRKAAAAAAAQGGQ